MDGCQSSLHDTTVGLSSTGRVSVRPCHALGDCPGVPHLHPGWPPAPL